MFHKIRARLKLGSLNRSEHMLEGGQQVENTDAAAAIISHSAPGADAIGHEPIGGGMPPNYVHSYDEGRPRSSRPRPLRLRADEGIEVATLGARAIETESHRFQVYSTPTRRHASQKSRRMSSETWLKNLGAHENAAGGTRTHTGLCPSSF